MEKSTSSRIEICVIALASRTSGDMYTQCFPYTASHMYAVFMKDELSQHETQAT